MSSDSTERALIVPMLAGIGPVRRFSNRFKTRRAVNASMLGGIVPDKRLKVKSKVCNDVMSTIVEGIVPAMEFALITNFVMLWKYPISDGNDPDRLRSTRLMEATLPKLEEPDTFPHVTP